MDTSEAIELCKFIKAKAQLHILREKAPNKLMVVTDMTTIFTVADRIMKELENATK